jgi:hypothetical protein
LQRNVPCAWGSDKPTTMLSMDMMVVLLLVLLQSDDSDCAR